MKFLGYIICGDGICIDPHKVQTIMDWATLAFVRDVQWFFKSSPISIDNSLHIIP
jgi:hypothetical protein